MTGGLRVLSGQFSHSLSRDPVSDVTASGAPLARSALYRPAASSSVQPHAIRHAARGRSLYRRAISAAISA